MREIEKSIYGIPIVPYHGEDGRLYGGFEGIVISNTSLNFDSIEILKTVNKDNVYFIESFIKVPTSELFAHSQTTGREKAEFLVSKAKEFSNGKGNGKENIAICSTLVPNLILMDESYGHEQGIINQRQKQR